MGSQVLRFASFELDCETRELRDGARRLRLQEQPFEILRALLERPGGVLTREELCRRLWPEGTFVDFEHSLNAAVKRLRAALGDEADAPRFIETIPRRGYRFIGPLTDAAAACAPDVPTCPLRLAVLPFSNLSDDVAQEYFSDGLTEEMIAQLGTLCRGRVGVLARWSSMMFKGSLQRAREVGDALRADYLLEGSVRRVGDRVRITARLVEAHEETQLWSETYDRALTDYLAVQGEVAGRIARALAMELVPSPSPTVPAVDAAAYQAYLKGKYYWTKTGDEGLEQALAFFGDALSIAPTFAAAHAAIARVNIAQAEYYREVPRTALERARRSALRALDFDPNVAEGHLALADVRRLLDFDWSGAESSYAQAVSLNPSHEGARRSLAMTMSAFGRHAEAIREIDRALELDPFCLVASSSAAWTRYAAGDHQGAIARCRHTMDLDPEFLPAQRLMAAAYLRLGKVEEALVVLDAALAIGPTDPVTLCWLAHAKGAMGASADARAVIDRVHGLEPMHHVSAYHFALAYTGVGDREKALALLDRAYRDRDPALTMVVVEPRFSPLRHDPAFDALLERLNLGARNSGSEREPEHEPRTENREV